MDKFKMADLEQAVATYLEIAENAGQNTYADFMTQLQYSTIKFQTKFWDAVQAAKN
jgi:hypothetical protein